MTAAYPSGTAGLVRRARHLLGSPMLPMDRRRAFVRALDAHAAGPPTAEGALEAGLWLAALALRGRELGPVELAALEPFLGEGGAWS